ncbi:MAG TPA: hypothetical protein VMD55_10030 [Terracidiphilus sp.]|nr:hypothetical protein [Terracidiphilus sp.]
MIELGVEYGTVPELSAEKIRAQLELLVHDEIFRSSKRSVAFLRYIVEQTLNGFADQIKERAIGAEVFGRDPSYDTNLDHIVRTAATELRKRLISYYADDKHRAELRIGLVPGSYIPRFSPPHHARHAAAEADAEAELSALHAGPHGELPQFKPAAAQGESTSAKNAASRGRRWAWLGAAATLAAGCLGYGWLHRASPQDLFWKPVLDTPGAVLVAVGDHPNGPPTLPESAASGGAPTPIPGSDASETVPFADTVTVARVVAALEERNKEVIIRRGNSSSFSDLREGAVVLVGAFNNEWSLRLTRQLRYSLDLDPEQHLIYIRDAKNPSSRSWSWATNQPSQPVTGVNSPRMHDYALISRIRDAGTGHVVVVIGGLYTYGTLAAGEFLTNASLMQEVARLANLKASQNLQIILGTTVTDGVPGPPNVLAVSAE